MPAESHCGPSIALGHSLSNPIKSFFSPAEQLIKWAMPYLLLLLTTTDPSLAGEDEAARGEPRAHSTPPPAR